MRRQLQGHRILVVEDEYFVADELGFLLEDHGAEVIGPIPSVSLAPDILDSSATIDCALLDVDLNGRVVFPLLESLMERGIPWIFVTGFLPEMIPANFQGSGYVAKPVNRASLLAALLGLLR